MSSFRHNSRRMALCGILAALALIFLQMGGLLPLATFCCPLLAMLCSLPALEEYGRRIALVLYTAVSLLALLMAPDKEAALLYAFWGWYPALRPGIDRAVPGKLLRLFLKLSLFAAAVSAMYALAILVLGMEDLAREYTEAGRWVAALTAALGCVVWILFDRVLLRFTLLYRHKWRKRLFRT